MFLATYPTAPAGFFIVIYYLIWVPLVIVFVRKSVSLDSTFKRLTLIGLAIPIAWFAKNAVLGLPYYYSIKSLLLTFMAEFIAYAFVFMAASLPLLGRYGEAATSRVGASP